MTMDPVTSPFYSDSAFPSQGKEATSPSSKSSVISADSPLDANDSLYVTHQVTKLDTLAGLAIKYGVSVSDIKRANSLMSDTAMFARGSVLIPTKKLPVGTDTAMLLGMICSGYGKHIGGSHGSSNQGGKGMGIASLDSNKASNSAALSALNDFYGLPNDGNSPADLQRQADAILHAAAQNGNVEVELMRMDSGADGFAGDRDGPKMDDRLRRRTGPTADEAPGPAPRVDSAPIPQIAAPPARPHVIPQQKKESLFEKFKRAASQPALAQPSRADSMSSAMDSLIGDGLRLSGSVSRGAALPPVKYAAKKD